MKIDSNINANFPQENFEPPGQIQKTDAAVPTVQSDQIEPFTESPEGPTGQVQQGLHSDNADGTTTDMGSDYRLGQDASWGASFLTGNPLFATIGLFDWAGGGSLSSDIGNFVDHTFDAVGGVFDDAGQGIGGVPGDVISWFGNAIADTPEAFTDALNWTEDTLSDGADAMGDGIETGAVATYDAVETVVNTATDAVDAVGDTAGDVIDTVTDW